MLLRLHYIQRIPSLTSFFFQIGLHGSGEIIRKLHYANSFLYHSIGGAAVTITRTDSDQSGNCNSQIVETDELQDQKMERILSYSKL